MKTNGLVVACRIVSGRKHFVSSNSNPEASDYARGVNVSSQSSANLSVPSSPLLDFDAQRLMQHYHAAEYEHMAAQFLAVLVFSRMVVLHQPLRIKIKKRATWYGKIC